MCWVFGAEGGEDKSTLNQMVQVRGEKKKSLKVSAKETVFSFQFTQCQSETRKVRRGEVA